MKAIFLASLSILGITSAQEEEPADAYAYAYDVSFPMLQLTVSTNYPWLPHNVDPKNNPTPEEYKNMPIQGLGNRQKFYDDYIQGCKDYWKEDGEDHRCDEYELQRLQQNIDQPPSMVNFTDVGYKKIKAPKHVFDMLVAFWEENKDNETDEEWIPGNIFVNYWETPSKFVDVANSDNKYGGDKLVDAIWESSVDTISEWTGQKLVPSSAYGIRVYKEGAILSCHGQSINQSDTICFWTRLELQR